MLQDELGLLQILVNDLVQSEPENDTFTAIGKTSVLQDFKIACEQVKKAWLAAFFSESPDHSLQRYFKFHLEGISGLSDTLLRMGQNNSQVDGDQLLFLAINEQLLALIIHLKKNHDRFFSNEVNSPVLWRKKVRQQNGAETEWLIERFKTSGLPDQQISPVIYYLSEIMNAEQGGFYTFHALNYFEQFVNTLSIAMDNFISNENDLNTHLTDLNFNHLGYFNYRQNQIGDQLNSIESPVSKIHTLLNDRLSLKNMSYHENIIYDTRYPSVPVMLDKWLCEQIIYLEEQHRLELENGLIPVYSKLTLNLSVAQMGCLLRVLYEADIFGNASLHEVFKFVTQHISSKKQAAISLGGLSKEYYSTTQVTGGKMIVLFQRLITILKRIFFPLLVVASVIAGV
jgi:hypothetical protein